MITFDWPVRGHKYHRVYLADALAEYGAGRGWPGILSANLAFASLLGRSADVGYENGVSDMQFTGMGRDPNPYYGCGYPGGGTS